MYNNVIFGKKHITDINHRQLLIYGITDINHRQLLIYGY